MIQLEMVFENTKLELLKEDFMNTLKNRLDISGIDTTGFNLTTVIKKEHMSSLVSVVHDYLNQIIGIKINNLTVIGYIDESELNLLHEFHIKCNKCRGMETHGFYSKFDRTVYVEIGKQLRALLPTFFHEFIHAYVHENNICIVDDYPEQKNSIGFTFAYKMCEASQEEGLCELASSIMCMHIFKINQYPSNVDKYWLGWRLCVQGFIEFFEIITKDKEKCDAVFVTKLSFKSLVNIIIKNHNLYKFVDKVPKNAYQQQKSITGGM